MSQPYLPAAAAPNVPLLTPYHEWVTSDTAGEETPMLAALDPDILFQRCTLEGKHLDGGGEPVDNTSTVEVWERRQDGSYTWAFDLPAGASVKYDAPVGGQRYNKQSFHFVVNTDDDGIHYFLD